MIRIEQNEARRVLVWPSQAMISRALAREADGIKQKRHWASEQCMNGFLAETCYHIALDRAGVEHRWHDDWGFVDITLHTGRTIDVKCRDADGGWHEHYGQSVPAYIVKRRMCDLVALSAWDGHVMTLTGILSLAGVVKAGTHLMAGQLYSSKKPVREECYEVLAPRIPRLANQLPALRRGSYAREQTPDWWMELWPQTA